MAKTYRSWAEIEGWSEREFRRQHKRKSNTNAKQHIREELAEMEEQDVTLAYVVVNEFVPTGSDVTAREELYYTFSGDDAHDVLSELADQLGAALDMGEDSFDAPASAGLEENYYQVEEIEIHG